MPYPPDHKAKTRRRILEAAGVRFRLGGFEGTGVSTVMREAGLTVGGFYNHFPDGKDGLFKETMEVGLQQLRERHKTAGGDATGPARVRQILSWYVSLGHVRHPDKGCLLPVLLPEVARSTEEVRATVFSSMQGWARGLAQHLPKLAKGSLDLATANSLVALAVGAVTTARAALDDAEATEVLDHCLAGIDVIIDAAEERARGES